MLWLKLVSIGELKQLKRAPISLHQSSKATSNNISTTLYALNARPMENSSAGAEEEKSDSGATKDDKTAPLQSETEASVYICMYVYLMRIYK